MRDYFYYGIEMKCVRFVTFILLQSMQSVTKFFVFPLHPFFISKTCFQLAEVFHELSFKCCFLYLVDLCPCLALGLFILDLCDLRCCHAQDLFGSQIPVTTGGFELQISCIQSSYLTQ